MRSWGRRIPFIIGAILSLVALYLRSNMNESEIFKNTKTNLKVNMVL